MPKCFSSICWVFCVFVFPVVINAQATHEVFIQDIEVFDTIINPCNDDAVTLSGIARFRLQYTFDGRGGREVTMHDNLQGVSGVGETGVNYRFVGASSLTGYSPNAQADPTVVTSIITALLVSEGVGANSIAISRFHFTITPVGVESAFLDRFELSCEPAAVQ